MHRWKRTFGWWIVMAMVATILAACGAGGTGGGGGASSEPIKIGAIFDLTGATAT